MSTEKEVIESAHCRLVTRVLMVDECFMFYVSSKTMSVSTSEARHRRPNL